MKRKLQIPRYVRLVDLAAQLDVTPQHLCNLVRRGVLPAIHVGAVIRVPIAAANKLLSEGAPAAQRGRRKTVVQP